MKLVNKDLYGNITFLMLFKYYILIPDFYIFVEYMPPDHPRTQIASTLPQLLMGLNEKDL